VDLIAVAEEVERRLRDLPEPLTVAVMGCAVNGPGEAREADIGLAGGEGQGLLFRSGEVVRKVPQAEMVEALVEEVQSLLAERCAGCHSQDEDH
jgi:(E)-4-hydroxy-3-methylbut-2-enyl-diphosphate synthase